MAITDMVQLLGDRLWKLLWELVMPVWWYWQERLTLFSYLAPRKDNLAQTSDCLVPQSLLKLVMAVALPNIRTQNGLTLTETGKLLTCKENEKSLSLRPRNTRVKSKPLQALMSFTGALMFGVAFSHWESLPPPGQETDTNELPPPLELHHRPSPWELGLSVASPGFGAAPSSSIVVLVLYLSTQGQRELLVRCGLAAALAGPDRAELGVCFSLGVRHERRQVEGLLEKQVEVASETEQYLLKHEGRVHGSVEPAAVAPHRKIPRFQFAAEEWDRKMFNAGRGQGLGLRSVCTLAKEKSRTVPLVLSQPERLGWARLGWAGQRGDGTGLGWAGLDWTGLSRAGLGLAKSPLVRHHVSITEVTAFSDRA
ncbi:hypothetical protein WISP_73288 [Willisornis vidua]|uniref:Uncharacterized protein n=1 Tax=Willisornis vidua TaxID=1566151 RepID=A0ABQ9DC25_9PASS|nr:hypothetical protein WISP_73288 [Willisornis vidua]